MFDLNFEPSIFTGWWHERKEKRSYATIRWFKNEENERFIVVESEDPEYKYPWDVTIAEYNPEKFIDIIIQGYDERGKVTVKVNTWGRWDDDIKREVKEVIEEFNLKQVSGVYRYKSFFSKDGEYGEGEIKVENGEVILIETE